MEPEHFSRPFVVVHRAAIDEHLIADYGCGVKQSTRWDLAKEQQSKKIIKVIIEHTIVKVDKLQDWPRGESSLEEMQQTETIFYLQGLCSLLRQSILSY